MSSDQEDLEAIHEAEDQVEVVERDENDVNDGNDPEPSKNREVIKPKRVRNPQPKLNAETLKGPRGLLAMPELFMRQKYKGKGHEEEDLRVLLKTYEYWCHRLFPKYTFGECVERLEKLGTKKAVITNIKKIRMGLLDLDEPKQKPVSSDEEESHEQQSNQDTQFDLLVREAGPSEAPQLTEEQLETIRINKERALKLRQEKLRKIQEQVQEKLTVSEKLPSQREKGVSDVKEGEESEDVKMREFEGKKGEDSEVMKMKVEGNKGVESEDENNVSFNRKGIDNENEETSFRKAKKRIVSDSEDESEEVKRKVRKVLLDSDESEDEKNESLKDEGDVEKEAISSRKVKKRILSDTEESDEDKENVLSNLGKASQDRMRDLVDEDSNKENEEMEVSENN